MSQLFSPLKLGSVTLPNRIAVAPMCQYSAEDGTPTDWHLQHLMQLAMTGAGLVMVEATGVERVGRITHGCLGIYSDENEAAIARVLGAARTVAPAGTRFGIQIAHAGRKASMPRALGGRQAARPGEDPWETVAPSAIPSPKAGRRPKALDEAGLERVSRGFLPGGRARRAARLRCDRAAQRARLPAARVRLSALQQAQRRLRRLRCENRMRFPLEVAAAVRAVVPRSVALGARITGTDWAEGGLEAEDAVAYAAALKAAGFDYVCVSGGGAVPQMKIPLGPGYQVPMAAKVRAGTGIATRAVGLIVEPGAGRGDRRLGPGRLRRAGARIPR